MSDGKGALIVTSASAERGSPPGQASAFVRLPGRSRFEAREALPFPTSPGTPSTPTDAETTEPAAPAVDPQSGRIVVAYVLAPTAKSEARLVVVVRDAPRDIGPDTR